MCLDKDNTSPDDIAKLKQLVADLGPESALGEFLAPLAEVLSAGGAICFGAPPPGLLDGLPGFNPGGGDTPPPPGIYPPGTFPDGPPA